MNIVIAGNADSIWIREYIKNVIEISNNNIYIISEQCDKYDEWYKKNNIQVLKFGTKNFFVENIKIVKIIGRCDVLHIQYVDIYMLMRTFLLAMYSKRYILTFWGSDLLRASKRKKIFYKPFLNYSNQIIVMTYSMKSVFEQLYGKKYNKKTRIIDFGNSVYEYIQQVDEKFGKDGCKKILKLPRDKYCIAIGYNSIKEQNHMQIIKNLIGVPQNILEKCYFVFHFGYGKYDEDYKEQLENVMKEHNFHYMFIERYLDLYEVAILRNSIDVFLYGQTTDAMSGSALEYVYAGSTFIKPKWLDYSELQNRHIKIWEYETFEEIKRVFCFVIKNQLFASKEEIVYAQNTLDKYNSWKVLKEQWRNMYK